MKTDPKLLFTRRALLLGAGQGLLTAGIVGRLYWLQVKSGQHFSALSDKNRLHSELILPERGQIFDEHGRILAGNQHMHRVLLNTMNIPEWQDSLHHVFELLKMEKDEREHVLSSFHLQNRLTSHIIKDPLSFEEVATLELHLMNLPGIRIEEAQRRFYPHPHAFCHTLGYVGKPSVKESLDAEEDQFDLYQNPGFRTGKSGIEKMYEGELLGNPGVKQVEVNARRHVVRELETFSPRHGNDLQTTINLELQQGIYERIKEFESACVVVMDVQTGGVKAAVSTPAFDMNHFINGIPKKIWSELRGNPKNPLLCKFAQGQYAPGSPFKIITALAGLTDKAITPETQFFCAGHYLLGGHKFHCWRHQHGHGHMNLRRALAESCDVYFYELALRIGVDSMARMARMFGMGAKTSLDFPHEKSGLIPSKSWKEKIMGKKWTLSETILTSIGQGYVMATPLQLCVMMARLAALGKKVEPTFILKNKHAMEDLGLSQKDLHLVCAGMRDVMSHPSGTAYGSRSELQGIDFAGKTGTAQVRRLSAQDRETKAFHNWPWHWRDHAIFTGYAPAINPQFAVSIVVEHGGSGSKVAAPLGRDVLTLALK